MNPLAPGDTQLQNIQAPILLGLYVLQKGHLTYVNAHFAAILGYDDPAPLIGRSLWALIPPEDHGRVRLQPISDKSHNGPVMQSFRMIKQDGRTVRVCLRGDRTLYQGQPANLGCLIDLNAMELMKAALQKYRHLINEIDDAIGELDLKCNLVFSNTSVCRKWETLGDKTQTLNIRTYLDENSMDAVLQYYKALYESGCPTKPIIYKVKLADGARLTVEDSVSLMEDEEGIISGFRIVSRNITARIAVEKKLARQRTELEAIFSSVNDAIITIDPEFKVMECNRSAQTVCGLISDKIIGKPFTECLHCCNRSCSEVVHQTIQNKKSFNNHRVLCRRGKAPHQIVSLSSSPLLDPENRFIGAVLVIRDITRLESMERELHQRHQHKNIIGKSEKVMEIFGMVGKLADLDTTVLITGESGTGKELVAKALHYSGRRAFKPFVSVNCSALNESLLESELFGHIKGAFTGAMRDKQGRFEAAEGGTLLLDEIGDTSPLIQLKLLRVLQEKTFERVGESVSRKADVRIIASTNKDLKEKIRKGEFREDLFYRLKVVQIPLPPLRQRTDDIPLLMDHFRILFNKRFNKNVNGFTAEVRHRFMSYPWPGNVRELEHLIERAFVLCRGSEIQMEHLPLEVDHFTPYQEIRVRTVADRSKNMAQKIKDLLVQTQWNKSRVAQLLGVSRQTLYRKMREYQIND